jgi:D-2-hydroxyacid dehydrogenase (NADP+)
MDVRSLGIDASVARAFPPADLRAALSSLPVPVRLVGEGADDVADGTDLPDAVVTLRHRPAFLGGGLRWLHTVGVGTDHLPVDDYRDRGVVVTNSPEVNSTAVAETALAAVFSLAGRAGPLSVGGGPDAATVSGATLCLVGLGAIGGRVARRAAALGARVVGVSRSGEAVPGVDRALTADRLDEALASARFVVLAVPLTDATRGLVGRAELDAMPDDAALVNVSRGEVVDESALLAALDAGELAGAALDTFAEEPLPPSSPFWDRTDVLVTPHAAGLHAGYAGAVADVVDATLSALRAGETPENRVA